MYLIDYLRKEDIDVILFFNFSPKNAVPAIVQKIVYDIPIVVQWEDAVSKGPLTDYNHFAQKLLYPLTVKFLGGAVCCSNEMETVLPIDNTDVKYRMPSIGMPDELPDGPKREDTCVVMFSGHLDEFRNVGLFIKSAAAVDNRKVEFWISGHGSDREISRVRSLLDDADDDRIRFFGMLPWQEYQERLDTADVLVNLQDPDSIYSSYNFPTKFMDYMSSGGTIISTPISDIPHLFSEHVYIVKPNKSNVTCAFEEVLQDIEKNPSRTEKASLHQREWVIDNVNYQSVGGKYRRVLLAAVDGS